MIINKLKHLSISVVLIITLIDVSYSQINLVQNPSFEFIYSCPSGWGQLDSAIGWSTPINGGGGNPELFHTCCTFPSICGVPLNYNNYGFQNPHSENAYIGIDVALVTYPNNFREYTQSKLLSGLTANKSYCVKFYVSLVDNCMAYITQIGAYFDDGSVSAPSHLGLISVTPQVYHTQFPLNDTINWMKIEGSFKASGDEEYITIGNFFTDSVSGLELFDTVSHWYSYYYIDDVSVIEEDLPAYAGNDTLIQSGDSVFIGRQPEIGLDEDCIWFVNGVPIDTVAGLWVQPDSTTTYIVLQTICGNVQWDTVTVSVYGTGIANFFNDATFKIYPNPATSLLTIESPVTNATLSISNLLGQELIQQEVTEKLFSIDISKLQKGIYFVKLFFENGIVVKKFLKE